MEQKQTEERKEEDKVLKQIFHNLLRAIGIMVYFMMLNLIISYMDSEHIIKTIQIAAIVYMLLGIILMERAYKQDNGAKAIMAIEVIVLSIHALSIHYVEVKYQLNIPIYLLASSYLFASYYTLKCIFIYTRGRKQLLTSLSDIREITQKEEPIKKEATRKKKTKQVEEIKEEVKEPEEKVENQKESPKVKKESARKEVKVKSVKKKTTKKIKEGNEDKKVVKKNEAEKIATRKKPANKITTKKEEKPVRQKTQEKEGKEND